MKIPFDVKQPPVEGDGGVVYLAGDGLAAIQNGKMLWQHLSKKRMYATAFGNGWIAVSVGEELQIRRPDGAVDSTFTTELGEQLETPPAIAKDGTIWAASIKGLYSLR